MIHFRSIRSGSSANLLLLEDRDGGRPTRLLIDCGIRSQRDCARLLETEVGLTEPLDGILVTHAHSDHINYASLRVLDQVRVPIYAHTATVREIQGRYLRPEKVPASVDFSELKFREFDGPAPFALGAFQITPIRVPHAPGVTTHAFAIESEHSKKRALIASDFNDPEAVVPHIYDCDLVYLESNHDLELLRRYWNPASRFHLPNPDAGLLLSHAIQASRRPPQAVVLAHLSEDRNRPELASETTWLALKEQGLDDAVALHVAPRYEASEEIVIE